MASYTVDGLTITITLDDEQIASGISRFNVTQDIVAGNNTITHSLNKTARVVEFIVNGAREEFGWSINNSNSIIVTSVIDVSDVTINIIAW